MSELYIADAEEAALKFEVTYPADSDARAMQIAMERGWEYVGKLVDVYVVQDQERRGRYH